MSGGEAKERRARGRALIVLDQDDPSPDEFRSYFTDIFRSVDAMPRKLLVGVVTRNDREAAAWIDFEDGEPVFHVEGRKPVKGSLSKRWIPEHPVPLRFHEYGRTNLVLEPTGDGRIRVRKATFLERLFM